VGLGKSIEAGIIMYRYRQKGKRKVLLVVPASQIDQWKRELEEKFHLPVTTGNSRYLRRKNPPNPFVGDGIMLCSYQFAANKAKYLAGQPWDPCCIDEEHNLRNPHGKISTTLRKTLRDFPKLLLTATPIQNAMDDLYSLAALADRYFPVSSSNEVRDSRWKPLLIRTLRKDSKINFANRFTVTSDFNLSEFEKQRSQRFRG